ncbi:MAG: VCBS repeat-containing protein [Candidatus Altiarchaeota archaeon]
MRFKSNIIKTLAILTTIVFLSDTVISQEIEVLSKVWEHELGALLIEKPMILKLFVADINRDGRAEISAITTGRTTTGYTKDKNRVYVFRNNGSTYWELGVDDTILDVVLFDVDNDHNLEHVIAAGEEREKLQRGQVQVVGWNGEVLRTFKLSALIDSIAIGDINGDQYYEIGLGSQKRLMVYHRNGERLWMFPPKGEGLLNSTVGKIAFGDVDGDGNEEIIAGSDKLYYIRKNLQLEAVIDIDPDTPLLKKTVKYLDVLDMSQNKLPEVVAVNSNNKLYSIGVFEVRKLGSGENAIIDLILEKSWTKSFDCDITKIIPLNMDNDVFSELLVSCSDHILRMVDNNGVVKWQYIVDGDIRDTVISDMDEDNIQDILVGSSVGTVYLLDLAGNFKWKYSTGKGIEKMGTGDLNYDNIPDLVILSEEPAITAYVVNQSFTLKRRADMYYKLGRENYISSNWDSAEEYMLKAKALYSELEYVRGIEDSQEILSMIGDRRIDRRRAEANIYYEKAQESFISGDYEQAKIFVQRSKEMYTEFGDTENILKCELMEIRLEKLMKGDVEPGELPKMNKTDTPPEDDNKGLDYRTIGIAAALIVIVLIILAKRKGRGEELIEQEKDVTDELWGEDDPLSKGGGLT